MGIGKQFPPALTRCLDQKCRNTTEKHSFEPKACLLLPWVFAAQQVSWEEIALFWNPDLNFSSWERFISQPRRYIFNFKDFDPAEKKNYSFPLIFLYTFSCFFLS